MRHGESYRERCARLRKQLGPAWPFLSYYLAAAGVLALFRFCFVLWQWERVAEVNGFFQVMLTGLRMDTILLCELLGLPVIVYFFLPDQGALGRFRQKFSRAWLLGVSLLLVFMEVATPPYISQYDTRPSRVFIEYLIYPKEVLGTLWFAYKPELLIGAVAMSIVVAFGGRFLKSLHAAAVPWSWRKQVMIFPVVGVILFLGARSSLGHRAANPSIAAFSNDHLVNDLAVNSTYNVLFALYNLKHEEDSSEMYGKMTAEEVIETVRESMQVFREPIRFVSEDVPTRHRQRPSRTRERPYNLVIVLEESLGAQYNKALGGEDLTPEITKWGKKGWWFSQMYATGTRSVRGIEAIVTGFPPSPSRSVVKLSKSQTGFYSIARTLKNQGYTTEFLYGGESHFDNMRRFFLGNGFDTVIDQNDYDDPVFLATWGVSDEDLFQMAHERFTAHGDQPFFALVFTSSFHSPFEYPEGRIQPIGDIAYTEKNAVKYADYALGKFLSQAEKSSYWDDTIFLVVADHDSRVFGQTLVPVKHFHIPAFIVGGGIAPAVYSKTASQLDLPPTLLSLMGIEAEHPMIGCDLTQFPEDVPGRAMFQYEKYYGYMEGEKVAVYQPKIAPQSFFYRNRTLEPAPAFTEDFLKKGLAHVLWPNLMYREQRYR
ncbi:MAG: LTA synthase family protein [Nitrospiria bacterium]